MVMKSERLGFCSLNTCVKLGEFFCRLDLDIVLQNLNNSETDLDKKKV